MIDYSDYRVWKDEELYLDAIEHFSEHVEYSVEDVYTICKRLMSVAEERRLEGCYLKFESHMEPYEDNLGSPSITACGYRKLHQSEIAVQEEQDLIQAKATELGVTYYEASIIMRLQRQGVI